MKSKPENPQPEVKCSPPLFSKEQLLASKSFESRKDALNVLLDDNKLYSIENTNQILNKFLKGKVV